MSDVDVPQDEPVVDEVPVDDLGADAPVDEPAIVDGDVEAADDGVAVEAAPDPMPDLPIRTFENSVTLPDLGGSLDSQIVTIGGVDYDQRFTPNPVLERLAAEAAEAESL